MTEIIGVIAAILGTIGLIPQAVKCLVHKQTRDISIPTFILLVLAFSLWFIYGLMGQDYPLIFSNLIALTVAILILIAKKRYG